MFIFPRVALQFISFWRFLCPECGGLECYVQFRPPSLMATWAQHGPGVMEVEMNEAVSIANDKRDGGFFRNKKVPGNSYVFVCTTQILFLISDQSFHLVKLHLVNYSKKHSAWFDLWVREHAQEWKGNSSKGPDSYSESELKLNLDTAITTNNSCSFIKSKWAIVWWKLI